MAKSSSDHVRQPRTSLLISHKAAREKIQTRVDEGNNLLQMKISSKRQLTEVKGLFSRWDNYNSELLKRIVDTDEFYNYYNPVVLGGWGVYDSLRLEVQELDKGIESKINRLMSLLDRLELIPEAVLESDGSTGSTGQETEITNLVFVVHGHDEEAKQTVARFIEKVDLVPVILHEQANEGRTVIEKFEDYSDVSFAVVILTPDDEGAPISDPNKPEIERKLKPRARQNVVFELGFFIGKLGRKKVCALYKGDIELPSDYDGVIWISFEANNAWMLDLAREFKSAGLPFDADKML